MHGKLLLRKLHWNMSKRNIYPIFIPQGATFQQSIAWKAPDGVTAIDLTGYTATMMVRSDYITPDPPLVSISTAGGGIVLGGVLGTILLTISATLTGALTAPQDCVYDVKLVAPDGTITRILEGVATITPKVTT